MSRTSSNRGVVIVGATSAIARAIARRYAERGSRILLAGRDLDECERIAADLRTRHNANASAIQLDLEDMDPTTFAREANDRLDGALDELILCQGFMADQEDAERNPDFVRRTMEVNLTSVVLLCEAIAPIMRAPGGSIVALSSVAGDRGRPSNHIYGSSKAGVNAYLEGLSSRLHDADISVLTVKPGFTDTAMTWGLDGMFLVTSPDDVAASVMKATAKGRSTLYTPWFWRGIMLIIRSIPGAIFKRLSL